MTPALTKEEFKLLYAGIDRDFCPIEDQNRVDEILEKIAQAFFRTILPRNHL